MSSASTVTTTAITTPIRSWPTLLSPASASRTDAANRVAPPVSALRTAATAGSSDGTRAPSSPTCCAKSSGCPTIAAVPATSFAASSWDSASAAAASRSLTVLAAAQASAAGPCRASTPSRVSSVSPVMVQAASAAATADDAVPKSHAASGFRTAAGTTQSPTAAARAWYAVRASARRASVALSVVAPYSRSRFEARSAPAPAGASASSSTASSQSFQVATFVPRVAAGSAAYGSRRSSSAVSAAVMRSVPATPPTRVTT